MVSLFLSSARTARAACSRQRLTLAGGAREEPLPFWTWMPNPPSGGSPRARRTMCGCRPSFAWWPLLLY